MQQLIAIKMQRRYYALIIAVIAILVGLLIPSSDRQYPFDPIEISSLSSKDVDGNVMMDGYYDLKGAVAPRMTGSLLLFFSRLVYTWPFSSWLLSFLYKENEFIFARQFAAKLSPHTEPSFFPIYHPNDDEIAERNRRASNGISVDEFQSHRPSKELFEGIGWEFCRIDDFISAYHSKKVTPADIVQAVLFAVRHSNSNYSLNAVTQTNEAFAMMAAEESLKRYQEGSARRLEGVPVVVKEELMAAGFITTVGTTLVSYRANSQEESTAVQRLRAAGAILIGLTNMHEIGLGTSGANPHFGIPRNAHHTDKYPGGSSSGSAAAVASCIVPLALGTDGGGSVRIPAAFNGIVGLKATYGRVSNAGAYPLDWTVGHIGSMARTVYDTALAYSIIAGEDSRDRNTRYFPPIHFHEYFNQNLAGVKLGVYWPWFNDADADIVSAALQAVKDLERRGATIVNISSIPHLRVQQIAHVITITSEMATSMEQFFLNGTYTQLNPETLISLSMARMFSSRDYLSAQRIRTYSIELWNHLFQLYSIDAVITPTTAIRPPPISVDALSHGETDLEVTTRIMRYAFIGNFVGLPAITIPIAPADDINSPIGLQLMSRHTNEDILFRIGATLEEIRFTDYKSTIKPPQVLYNIIQTAIDAQKKK